MVILPACLFLSGELLYADLPPLDELARRNDLPLRVALTRAVKLKTEDSSRILVPAGVAVQVVSVQNALLRVRYRDAVGSVAPADTDLEERVLLLQRYAAETSPGPATTAPVTPISREPRTFKPLPPGSALSKIDVPGDDSKESWKKYLDKVLAAMKGRSPENGSRKDGAIETLAQVGPENVDLLLGALGQDDYMIEFYLREAVDTVANESNKHLIIKALAAYPRLIETPQHMGWETEIKTIVEDALRENRRGLPNEWFLVAAGYHDPKTNYMVRRYLMESPSPAFALDALAHKSDLDVADIILLRLKEAQADPVYTLDESYNLSEMAAQMGRIEGLRIMVAIITETFSPDRAFSPGSAKIYKKKARDTFQYMTSVTGTDEELEKWFRDNSAQLVFDPVQQRYNLPH